MQVASAQVLRDLYIMLPNEEKNQFLQMVGQMSAAEAPFVITNQLPDLEKARFGQMIFDQFIWRLFPQMLRQALEVVREMPEAGCSEMEEKLIQKSNDAMAEYNAAIRDKVTAELQESRNRSSDPETIKRNVEICDLKKGHPELSNQQIAKRHGITREAIRGILKEEDKWRRLATKLLVPTKMASN